MKWCLFRDLVFNVCFKPYFHPSFPQKKRFISEASLNSISGRKLWEAEFQRLFLAPVFTRADELINEAQKSVLRSKQLSALER